MDITQDGMVPWKCGYCGMVEGYAKRDTPIECANCRQVTQAPHWATPRPWPSECRPTAPELAQWLGECTDWERLEMAEAMLRNSERLQACYTEDHAGMRAEIHHSRAARSRVYALCNEWDEVSRGETPTTKAIRAALK